MKLLKKIGIIAVCAVVAVASNVQAVFGAWASWELFGMAVNNIEGYFHTQQLISEISNVGDEAEILDTYTFVGNYSGTGNHCDLVSAALVRTERFADLSYHAGQWCEVCTTLSELHEYEYDYEEWSRQLDFPEDETNCYLLIKIDSAPFKDNIMGH